MATILNKGITRESKEQHNDRSIMVTLNEDQTISFKLKGLRIGEHKIKIIDLYKQLAGITDIDKEKEGPISITKTKKDKTPKGDKLISLNDLRSHNAISTASTAIVSQLDGVIKSVIDSQ
jgi:hypothetical protein